MPLRGAILSRIHKYIADIQPRDDYKELLQLPLIFLGDVTENGGKFKQPGAMHHARWLSKALYSLKVWMFRGQFKLSAKEEKGLRSICIFVVMHYIDLWYTASLPIKAPANALEFLKNMIAFSKIDSRISKDACDKIKNHLWYLSEHTVGFSFFDEGVQIEELRKMVTHSKTEKAANKFSLG